MEPALFNPINRSGITVTYSCLGKSAWAHVRAKEIYPVGTYCWSRRREALVAAQRFQVKVKCTVVL